MRKENRGKHLNKDLESKRWLSVVGFLISITLLSFAIFLSINQENIDRLASVNEYDVSNYTMATSSEINSSINDILSNDISTTAPIVINELNEANVVSNDITSIKNEVENETNKNDIQTNSNSDTNEENLEIDQEEEKKESKQFIMPVNGEIYKEYSMDSLVYSDTLQEWVTHRGIDIQANVSEDVKACANGTVKSIKNDPRYGWSITIEHKDGFSTTYTCLREANLVNEGDSVEQGQVIGKVGNSGVFESADGSHLHFEMIKDGGYINPELYLK